MTTANKHIDSNFDDFLRAEGIFEEVEAAALNRVVAERIRETIRERMALARAPGTTFVTNEDAFLCSQKRLLAKLKPQSPPRTQDLGRASTTLLNGNA